MTAPATPDSNGEQPFISHLVELRDRLLRMVVAVLAVFVVLFPFANDIYTLLARPLMRHLPEGSSMIATEVASPFLTPFKLALVLSFFIAIPYVLYQVWGFVAPGLYRHEKRLVLPLVVSSTLLYYLGMAFAYFVVFPMIFGFFISVAPEGVAVMTDISSYLDFVLKLFFAFGVAFEVPVATVLLVVTGMTTPKALAEKRPYIIVGVFVVAMLLTPPDVVSQTLLALPVWLLFEGGILMSRVIVRRRGQGEGDDAPDPDSRPPSSPGPTPTPPPVTPAAAASTPAAAGAAAAGGAGVMAAAGSAVPSALLVEDLFDDEDYDDEDGEGDEADEEDEEDEYAGGGEAETASDGGEEPPVADVTTPESETASRVAPDDRFIADGSVEELELMSGEPEPSVDDGRELHGQHPS